eukprot:TRINITY_DN6461_c0_g1_i11.p2 TRINITY_DN6461_c0_g1~~TRINITY_DN6461_c0_g1_i11.p2  ORF type:complete len:230 (+),score=46.73 TRINITY_DN6461_c0_g1_i11:98-787(+)
MSKFSEDQLTEFREAFALYDRNFDGRVNVKELGTIMRALGNNPSENELATMMSEEGSGGELDFTGFLNVMSKKGRDDDNEDDILNVFKVFDRDGDGKISLQELKNVMRILGENLTDKEIAEMIKEADQDGDGMIDERDFVRMMISKQTNSLLCVLLYLVRLSRLLGNLRMLRFSTKWIRAFCLLAFRHIITCGVYVGSTYIFTRILTIVVENTYQVGMHTNKKGEIAAV